MHAFGNFSDQLYHDEKTKFLKMFDEYRDGSVSLNDCQSKLHKRIVQFKITYLLSQAFLNPCQRI
jgi:uncharacterized protein YbgA (DUF1722 family)